MRCAACNVKMSEFEMLMKAPDSGEFADLCGVCYAIAYDCEDKAESLDDSIGGIKDEQDR